MCLFPTCSAHPESNGYCVFHRIYAKSIPVPIKKEIAKRSVKRDKQIRIAKKEYQEFLSIPNNKLCKAKLDGCTRISTAVHHLKGRENEMLLNKQFWLATCSSCNLAIESNDALARSLGLKLNKHSKN